jgi:uncharacterized protein YcbK (DUF882 family)
MTTKRKKFLIWSISVMLLVAIGISIYKSAPTYTKTLEYGGHQVKYDQYYFGEEKLWEHHYYTNDMLYESAQLRLASRLCKDFRQNKNPKIGHKIRSLFNELEVQNSDTMQIDSLINFFEDNYDTVIYIE